MSQLSVVEERRRVFLTDSGAGGEVCALDADSVVEEGQC